MGVPAEKNTLPKNMADMVIFHFGCSNRAGWDHRQPWQNGHGGRCVRILAIRHGEKRRICRKNQFVGVAGLAVCFVGMALQGGQEKRNVPSGREAAVAGEGLGEVRQAMPFCKLAVASRAAAWYN